MTFSPDLHLAALRRWMTANGCDVYVVPTADPHGSEYIADCWKSREWLTGFTGSAGTAVVTQQEACLWVDSRYWLQADEQLAGTAFTAMHDGAEGVPSWEDWARAHLAEAGAAQRVALDGRLFSAKEVEALQKTFGGAVAEELLGADPFAEIWTDRPSLPESEVVVQALAFAQYTTAEKVSQLRERLGAELAEAAVLVTDLADIAWLLNLRGGDIEYNPVFYAYLALAPQGGGTLYTQASRLTDAARQQIAEAGVELRPYDAWREAFGGGRDTEWVLFESASSAVVSHARSLGIGLTFIPSPLDMLRAIKNEAEQEGFRRAMERDGVAMVKFLRWLDEAEELPTEMGVDEKLTALRAEQDRFCGLSFGTIAAYGPHGAIVHYEATPETDAPLQPHSFLLLDSGAQFEDGTTDITRTITLGELTEEERKVYTLVLKGHIALARLRFPEGTTGLELDLAAREAMWREGYDFGHGTGHGVGSHLCVHEGPHQIRKNARACTLVPFRPGMTITDEPGLYLPGEFGVRIENLLLVVPDGETPFGRFCRFETLTLCPIDLRPVLPGILSDEEAAWLNAYHAEVRRRLLPLLADEADREWLLKATEHFTNLPY